MTERRAEYADGAPHAGWIFLFVAIGPFLLAAVDDDPRRENWPKIVFGLAGLILWLTVATVVLFGV